MNQYLIIIIILTEMTHMNVAGSSISGRGGRGVEIM